jgi:signal transduction histidine kinase
MPQPSAGVSAAASDQSLVLHVRPRYDDAWAGAGYRFAVSPRRTLIALDAAAAAAVCAVYLVFASFDGSDGTPAFTGPAWLAWLTAAAVGGPIAVRRRWPLASTAVTVVGCVAAALLDLTREPFVPAAIVLYSVGALTGLRRSAAALIGTLAVLGAGLFAGLYVVTPSENLSGAVGLTCMTLIVAGAGWVSGAAVRRRRERDRRARASEQARVVSEERMRIARELHDVVSHSLSLIAIQAGVANHVADTQPGRAREALRSIESTSREALAEMRGALTVLRSNADPADALGPTPGLDDLEALFERTRAAGVSVDATVDAPARVPAGVALAVYRVAQESLTNVVKHAGGGRCTVTVRHDRDTITAEVVDDGPHRPGGNPGHGLIGMRERVLMYGGTFTAGPSPTGGFAVKAVLPYAKGTSR